MKTRYWIQEQAPDGGYFDSFGINSRTEDQAVEVLRGWQESFRDRTFRLVERVDTVIPTQDSPTARQTPGKGIPAAHVTLTKAEHAALVEVADAARQCSERV